jgi:CspA family cold shock protein
VREDRGFGFIRPSGGGDEVFFHATDLVGLDFDPLLYERRVRFDIVDSPKGPRAANVQAAE